MRRAVRVALGMGAALVVAALAVTAPPPTGSSRVAATGKPTAPATAPEPTPTEPPPADPTGAIGQTATAAAPTQEARTDIVSGPFQPAARVRPLRSFTMAATGDVITENAVLAAGQAYGAASGARYDFAPLYAPVAPLLGSVDLAICHMETPIGLPGQRPGNYGPSPFGGSLLLAPYEMASSLQRTGYDRCSTASNHSNDLGAGGMASTLAALDSAGITHTGTARSPAEAAPQVLQVNDVGVAHLSYTRFSNTVRPAEGWRLAFAASVAQVAADVAVAREAGAEIVIVSLHILREQLRAPTPEDRAFVTQLTAATKVDVVVEHGPHVIQPVERVNGTWVYWSVGNFSSGMGQPGVSPFGPASLDGLVALVRVTETQIGRFEITPASVLICNTKSSRVVYPVRATLAQPGLPAWLRAELEASLARTLPVVPDVT